MPFKLVRNDITKLTVDAIVNAANTELQMGGGVCGAIFAAAGAERLRNACGYLSPIKAGEAVITQGYDLPAKYIIHAVEPVYHDGKQSEEALLRSYYNNSLELAVKYNCESIAFPLFSSGTHGYPKHDALRVATAAIRDFLCEHDISVLLVVSDMAAFDVSEELLGAVDSYIDEHYAPDEEILRSNLFNVEREASPKVDVMEASMFIAYETGTADSEATPKGASLDDLIDNLDESFSSTLLRLIDVTGKKDSEVYNRANIDRRLFSKIRSNAHYTPSKPTVLAFAIALELNLYQTEDLLKRAGFALSHSRKFDVIVEYFIQSKQYNIFEINEVLFSYDQPLLGG